MEELEFKGFGKIRRLNRDIIVTEKVDGSNGQLAFSESGEMLVGSRKKQIWPEGTPGRNKGCDNFGFARWAYENQEALFEFLGAGRHYGEWCGSSIQRKYDLKSKKFLLFNTGVFKPEEIPEQLAARGLGVVPLLYSGAFSTDAIKEAMDKLLVNGSQVNSGFMNPEGIIVYHTAAGVYFKATYKNDTHGKG